MAEHNITKIVIGSNTYVLHDGELDTWREGLDVTSGTNVGNSNTFLTEIKQEDGKITYKYATADGSDINDIGSEYTTHTNIPTVGAVKSYIDSTLSAMSKITLNVVETLPTASADTLNVIYLVKDSHSDSDDVFDEYLTVVQDGKYSWEKIGNTDVDLSGLVTGVTVKSATFTGTEKSHSHGFSGSVTVNYDKTTAAATDYANENSTKTVSYTPSGTVSVSVSGTSADFVNEVTPSDYSATYVKEATLVDSWANDTLTLTFSAPTETKTVVTSVAAKTGKAVSVLATPTASFTGTADTITLPKLSTTLTTASTASSAGTFTGTTETTAVKPEGNVVVDLTVNKHQ